MSGLLTWLQAGASFGVVAALFGLLTVIVKTMPVWRKVDVDRDSGLRIDMRAQISELRQEVRDSDERSRERDMQCRLENRELTGQVFVLSRALFLVMGEAELANPNSIAVAMAKKALQEAFPLQPLSQDMTKIAADFEKRDAAKP